MASGSFHKLRHLLKAGVMKLSLLHQLAFAPEEHHRNLIPAQIAVIAVFVVAAPARIVFRGAYRQIADRAAAVTVSAAG